MCSCFTTIPFPMDGPTSVGLPRELELSQKRHKFTVALNYVHGRMKTIFALCFISCIINSLQKHGGKHGQLF